MSEFFPPPPPPYPEEPAPGTLPLWANMVIALVAVSFSALFSGLTLGLMSLDKHGLEILMKGGDEKERKYASGCPLPPVARLHSPPPLPASTLKTVPAPSSPL